jgi:arylsulfatase A-like enzyme
MPQNGTPNLLLIWTDEQRDDTMAAYGNTFIQTPNLNRIAEGAFVFQRAYCTQPVCTPSRASILTGLWPHTHGCIRNNTPLPTAHPTLAEMLGASAGSADYHCAYYGKWHLGDEIVAQRGFNEWLSIEDSIYRPFYSRPAYLERRSDYHHYLVRQGYEPNATAVDGAKVFSRDFAAQLPVEHTKAAYLGREAARFIREQSRDRPWVLSVNFLEPHMPFVGPLNELHDPPQIPVGPAFGIPPAANVATRKRQNAARFRERGFGGLPLRTESDWRRLRGRYYGLVSLVDRAVGTIMEALDASGQAGRTIVVYTSDHGDMMGDHACLTKGITYEEAVRIPLLIRVPWLKQTQTMVQGRVSQVDLAPTLLDLMGQEPQAQVQGTTRADVLRGDATLQDNDVMVEWNGDETWRTIVSRENWKLNLCATDQSEFYDLNLDPYELENRFEDPAYRAQIDELTARIQAWQHATGDVEALNILA